MRLSSLGLAAAIFIASPAVGQNNATTTSNVTSANEMSGNAEAATNATLEAATPGAQAISPSAVAQTANAPQPPRVERGFPWGILGVLGLLGLMGRRRSAS